ncbi:hypothetical protein FQN53_001858 [Emmonsiellopsis sp. PD_33]|nr:hypothetical protein FQN53_001858 [Emmonsiellopsis sp. PD_33]
MRETDPITNDVAGGQDFKFCVEKGAGQWPILVDGLGMIGRHGLAVSRAQSSLFRTGYFVNAALDAYGWQCLRLLLGVAAVRISYPGDLSISICSWPWTGLLRGRRRASNVVMRPSRRSKPVVVNAAHATEGVTPSLTTAAVAPLLLPAKNLMKRPNQQRELPDTSTRAKPAQIWIVSRNSKPSASIASLERRRKRPPAAVWLLSAVRM